MKKMDRGILYHTVASPLILFLIVCLGVPTLGYFFYKHTHILSFHEEVIKESLNSKIFLLQKWLTDAKKEVETIASNDLIKTSFLAQVNKHQDNKTHKKKPKDTTGDTSKIRTHSFLKAKLTDNRFSLISIISKDGRIIDSTSQDLINHSIADTDLYNTLTSKGDKTIIVGFWKNGQDKYVIDLITPIREDNQEIRGYLHCALNMDTIASLLEYKQSHVISFDITDKQGYILISSNPSLIKTKIHEPKIINTGDKPLYVGNEIINSSSIKDIDLIIVQRSKMYDVFYPLIEISVFYLFIILFVLFILIRQAIYLKRKVVKPLLSVTSTLKSASAGIQTVTIKGKYPYEIGILLQEINNIIEVFTKSKETSDIKAKTVVEEVPTLKKEEQQAIIKNKFQTFLYESSTVDKDEIYKSISEILEESEGLKTYPLTRERLLSLVCLIQNYKFINEINPDDPEKEFSFREMFEDIAKEISLLMSITKTEAICEYDDSLEYVSLTTRKDVLIRVISTIIHNAFATTTDGTITVFCRLNEEPTKHLLVLISDKYKDEQENNLILIAKHLCDNFGYMLSVETLKDKGTTYYLKINL